MYQSFYKDRVISSEASVIFFIWLLISSNFLLLLLHDEEAGHAGAQSMFLSDIIFLKRSQQLSVRKGQNKITLDDVITAYDVI